MKEYNPEDTINFVSILDEDWECRYDGKLYKIPARSSTPYRVVVAQHFAKHMVDKILQELYDKEAKTKKIELSSPKHPRAKLFIDPRRWEYYKEILPELADLVEEFKNSGGKELLERKPTAGMPEMKR